MKNNDNYKVIGLMSGTSLDGLDIAYCEFTREDGRWSFILQKAETIEYQRELHEKLQSGTELSGLELTALDVQLALWMGKGVNTFIRKHDLSPDLIASHGHTIFHQPERGITLQIGKGSTLAAVTGLPVVFDFRSLDVALGGQGAPLVPIGDQLLFHKYDFCLNLGGIVNISYESGGVRYALDICPGNMPLNYLAAKEGMPYDAGGDMARSGRLIPDLLRELNALKYYSLSGPKSLGYEWVRAEVLSLLESNSSPVVDLMYTIVEHISYQIAQLISQTGRTGRLLITGGGAFNNYLIERMKAYLPANIVVEVPSAEIISYKEAIIFAFLGVLRLRSEVNCLSSVTGAMRDNCGGTLIVI
ncbi:Anhydro-N-acetylmuramic acid kinase [Fulvivirga imtechensis AK7]|uniref:Anhydro-N-acetylmuramic acid kinase n=1 Tax=Fulvivirga imtechensis AK7 TaxID=1237149 RepID=L8JY86_9BACT|nr:anhydro-N-acetylmuramic acid kinase [Fulvivirga imtechensis]ELR72167.1 Anhydro-N-acetylmuramic acid kinase [Fulvivirga imtechensis AK7]